MLKRLGWLIGLSQRSRQTKTLDAHPYVATRVVKPVLMVDTVQEIAVYIHRFHNLDLFQQGYTLLSPSHLFLPLSILYPVSDSFNSLRWYQIKISMRWEDGDNNKSCGIPSRVVQYEGSYSLLHFSIIWQEYNLHNENQYIPQLLIQAQTTLLESGR